MLMYASDYDDVFCRAYTYAYSPPPGWFQQTWRTFTEPYVKNPQIYVCPSARWNVGASYGITRCQFRWYVVLNDWTRDTRWVCDAWALADIPDAATKGMIFDVNGQQTCCHDMDATRIQERNSAGQFVDPPRHNGGINVAFVDGHVKWYPRNFILTTQGSWWRR